MRRDKRRVAIRRRTRGTEVEIELSLEGSGRASIETPFPLLNELLEILNSSAGSDLRLTQSVNKHADDAYAVDDLASAMAEAYRRSLGSRPRIRQFGNAILPVGDALVLAAVDLISPPVFQFGATFRSKRLNGMDLVLLERFLNTFTDRLGASLHIRILSGAHDENRCRAMFVALGRAMAEACAEVERQGAREIAADVDYLEGIGRPPAGPAGLEEAVVEELDWSDLGTELDDVGVEDELPEPRDRRGRRDRGERAARGARGERGAQRVARSERAARGARSERSERLERPSPEERAEPLDRLRRGRPRRARAEDMLPDRGEPAAAEADDLQDLPELPDLGEFEPEAALAEGFESEVGSDEEGSAEEVVRRRRRRGRRGGRGRRREPEAQADAGDEDERREVEAGTPAPNAEPVGMTPASREATPWSRGWEEGPMRDSDRYGGEEAPDLEPGEPSALRAAGREQEEAPRFGRRSARIPRRGEAVEPAQPQAPTPDSESRDGEPERTEPLPEDEETPTNGVLDFITGMKEAKTVAAGKSRRRRR